MKIGIDLLPLNTQSYYRGMGKYTFNLVTNIIEMDNNNVYYLFHTPLELLDHFKKKNVVISHKRPTMEDVKELDIFHITSLFELAESTLMPSKLDCKIIVTIYDLIPVIFWDNYIETMDDKGKTEYFRRLGYLKSVDHILVISETTKNDLIELLEIPTNKIKVIYGSIDDIYETAHSSNIERKKIIQRYNIDGDFILNTPGMDYRKNIHGLFKSFYYLSKEIMKNLSLVLVCKLSEEEECSLRNQWKNLGLPSNRLILTNYIPTEDLVQLYDSAKMFIFPSLYEGLGIPVLEAMSRGCPVITSNNSSLAEICESAAIYINPYDPREIASTIEKLYQDNDIISKMKDTGLIQWKKFSWKKVALRVLKCYETFDHDIQKRSISNNKKYRIAFFTPLSPLSSGISDYSEELLPFLKDFFDIDIFIDNSYNPTNNDIIDNFNVYSHEKFSDINRDRSYDLCIYQTGNSEYHKYMLIYIIDYPGIVVLHDLNIHRFFYYVVCRENGVFNKKKYLDTAFRNHGYQAFNTIKKRIDQSPDTCDIFTYDISYNFTKEIIDNSILTLVHSRYGENLFKNSCHFCDINKIDMGCSIENSYENLVDKKIKSKKECRYVDDIIISAFGRIAFSKRIDVLLKAFSNLIKEKKMKNIKLILVGKLYNDMEKEVNDIIKNENLSDFVEITGFVDKNMFENYLYCTDICVNLRYPSAGETSATLIRALSAGVPVITTNYMQYNDFPNDCCWKVDIDDNEVNLLAEYLFELASNEKLRKIMSKNAYDYAKKNNSFENTIEQYRTAINHAIRYKETMLHEYK